MEQDPENPTVPAISAMAPGLCSATLLRHRDRAVRLLTLGSLASCLRIVAPQAPLNAGQLGDFFSGCVREWRQLGETKDVYHGEAFFLLESVASVKSIVLLFETADWEARWGAIWRLTEELLQNETGSLSRPVQQSLLELHQALLEDAPSVPRAVWQQLGLLAGAKPPSDFTRALWQAAGEALATPLAQLLHRTYLDHQASAQGENVEHGDDDDDESLTRLHEQIPRVASTAALAGGCPEQLLQELTVEEGEVRSLAVTALGQCLLRGMGNQALSPWLQRRHDRLVSVRLAWCSAAVPLIPSNNTAVIEAVQDRLCDPEERVREHLLEQLGKLVQQARQALPPALLQECLQRCRDRVEGVRVAALSLAAASLPQDASLYAPLLSLLYTPDRSVRLLYEYFLDHSVMQADMWAVIWKHCPQAAEREALRQWIRAKLQFNRLYQAMLILISEMDNQASSSVKLQQVQLLLADRFREPALALVMLKSLTRASPAYLADLQRLAVEQDAGQASRLLERLLEDNRVVEKPFLLAYLLRRASWISLNQASLSMLLMENQGEGWELVEMLMSEAPGLGEGLVSHLEGKILAGNEQLLTAFARLRREPSAAVAEYCEALLGSAPNLTTVKAAAKVLAQCPARASSLIPRLAADTAHPRRQQVAWTALVPLAETQAALLMPYVEELLVEWECLPAEDDPTVQIMACRFMRRCLIAVVTGGLDDGLEGKRWIEQALQHLQKQLSQGEKKDQLVYEWSKALVQLMPRPSLTWFLEKGKTLISLDSRLEEKLGRLLRNKQTGLLWSLTLKSFDCLARFRLDPNTIQGPLSISSQTVQYAECMLVPLCLSLCLEHAGSELSLELAERLSQQALEPFIEAVLCKGNLSLLLDLAVHLKHYRLVSPSSDAQAASRLLYLCSDLVIQMLKQRQQQHRWTLDATPMAIDLVEPALLARLDPDEHQKVLHKNYLARLQQAAKPSRSIVQTRLKMADPSSGRSSPVAEKRRNPTRAAKKETHLAEHSEEGEEENLGMLNKRVK